MTEDRRRRTEDAKRLKNQTQRLRSSLRIAYIVYRQKNPPEAGKLRGDFGGKKKIKNQKSKIKIAELLRGNFIWRLADRKRTKSEKRLCKCRKEFRIWVPDRRPSEQQSRVFATLREASRGWWLGFCICG